MRREDLALLAVEVKRHVISRRYVVVLGVMSLLIWRVISQMITYAANTHVAYNVWDVFLGLFGGTASLLPTAVVIPMLFVFLLGTSAQEDILSGYSLIVQARLRSKNSHWWIKVVAILAVVAITLVLSYALSLGLGAARGLSILPVTLSGAGGHPNAWGIARGVPPAYYSLPPGTNVVAHSLLVALYFTFAYFAVVMLVVGMTIRSKNLYAPMAIGALVTASGLATSYATSDLAYSFSLASALTESSHRSIPVVGLPPSYAVPWSHSLLLLCALLLAGVVVGALMTPTRVRRARGASRSDRVRPGFVTGATLPILAILSAALMAGCVPHDFVNGTMPQVPQVELRDLSRSDLRYLTRLAEMSVDLSVSVDALNQVWAPEYLHSSDEAMSVLLKDRLAATGAEIEQIRAVKVTPGLAHWYEQQYGPGLDELQYVVDNLDELYANRDHVGVRMCLKHITYANAFFSGAAQTIAPFAPKR